MSDHNRNKISEEFYKDLRDLPGGDGWWHVDGFETYVKWAEIMKAKGIAAETIDDMLGELYQAAAAEFGN